MTCSEMACLIFGYWKRDPQSQEEKLLKQHIRDCDDCQRFIRSMGERFGNGESEVSCGEIPNELLEALSSLIQKEHIIFRCVR